MQVQRIYSLESYEPAVLNPDEVKPNDNYFQGAFTEQKPPMPKIFFPVSQNNYNFGNNLQINIPTNNNYLYNNYNANISGIPTNIAENRPTIKRTNTLITNNLKNNIILRSPQNNIQYVFNNPFYNMMQYNNIPSSNYKQIIYRKTNSPKYKIINRNANNFYKAKNNTLYHNPSSILSSPKFNNLYQNANYNSKNKKLFYRGLFYKTKK